MRIYSATVVRILGQLRRDRRSVFMIVAVPAVLTILLYYVLSLQPRGLDGRRPFDRLAVIQLGVLPCAVMFAITAICMRRERANGTLERIFTTPLTKLQLLAGYSTAFSLAAMAQATVVTVVAFELLHLHTQGSPLLVFAIAILDAILGVTLGLFFSAFARSEFQAVQFTPIVLIPQLFVCGLLVPRNRMPGWLHTISNGLPLPYAVDALQEVSVHPGTTWTMWHSVIVVALFAIGAVFAGASTLRRTAD
ncbi:ABC transporter permease [Nocardia nepalensis]|uniref:ABC transporter permease n=1 Tax=Nocardia nepalensis TaxID=3375448 RepID=UPI003B67CA3A